MARTEEGKRELVTDVRRQREFMGVETRVEARLTYKTALRGLTPSESLRTCQAKSVKVRCCEEEGRG